MEILHRIQQMLLNGREREARELYFAELAPLLKEFHDALDDLLDHQAKQLDHDELWEKVRLSFEELDRPHSS